jgi:hypothetical protein
LAAAFFALAFAALAAFALATAPGLTDTVAAARAG